MIRIEACATILDELPAAVRSRVARRLNEEYAKEISEVSVNGEPSLIRQWVESEEFQLLKTTQDKYLAILRFLQENDPKKFAEVAPTIKGTKRKYFAMTEKEITDSGTNNEAAPIGLGEWWAAVNSNNDQKEEILNKLMQGLGYSKADIDLACKAIG